MNVLWIFQTFKESLWRHQRIFMKDSLGTYTLFSSRNLGRIKYTIFNRFLLFLDSWFIKNTLQKRVQRKGCDIDRSKKRKAQLHLESVLLKATKQSVTILWVLCITWNESLFNSICNRLKLLNFCAKNFTACLMCTLLLNTDTIQWHIHLCWRGKSATGKTTRDRGAVDVPLWWSST